MTILAILSDRNHKRGVRHFCHTHKMNSEIYDTDELSDIEPLASYDALVLASSYPDGSYTDILDQVTTYYPKAKGLPLALIDLDDLAYPDHYRVLREYELEEDLEEAFKVSPATATYQILFVSDDKLLHAIIKDLFKSTAVNLIEASDGAEGYTKYLKNQPDLILTDLEMPGLNGFELLEKIKVDHNDKDTKVVIYSSTADEANIIKAHELHAKGYLIKPLSPAVLKQKIEKFLTH